MDVQKTAGSLGVGIFLVLICTLAVLNNPTVFEPPYLLAVLNTLFLGIFPLAIAALAARVYLRRGSASLLLIGAGLLVFGLGSMAAGWVNPLPGGPNLTVTLHNTCALAGSILTFAGCLYGLGTFGPAGEQSRGIGVLALYGGVTVSFILLLLALFSGLLPPFFVPGSGPTVIRQVVLEDAVLFYALSSIVLMVACRHSRTGFISWYALAFALIATGLMAVFFQPSVGSLIGWVGRTAQYLGCTFALWAVIIARRTAMKEGQSLEDVIADFYHDSRNAGVLSTRILDTVAEGVVLTRVSDGIIVYTNPRFDSLFGYARSELLGKHVGHLNAPTESASPDQVAAEIGRVLQEQGEWSGSLLNIRKDGTPFWTFATITTLDHAVFGKVRVATQRNITEIRKAEELLRESSELFGEVLNNSNDAIFLLERTGEGPGRYILVNDKAVAMLGYSREELLTMSPRDIVPADTMRQVMPGVIERLEREGHATFESVHQRKDGSTYPVEVSTRTFTYKGRGVDLSTTRDITERKRAEEALRESEARYRAIFTAEGDAIIIIDHATRTILDCNDATLRLYGYRKEELVGRPVTVISAEPEYTADAIDEKQKYVPLRLHRREDGSEFPVEIMVDTVELKGRTVMVGAVRDITERRRNEAALRKANHQLKLLTSITRHDLRNQMLALSSYIGLASQTLDNPKQTEQFLDNAQAVAGEISRHIQFSREYQEIGSGETSWLDPETLMPAGWVPEDITFRQEVHGIEIYADPLLGKVFFNLLDNSRRHGQRVSEIRVYSITEGDDLLIVWEDNGIGIPSDEKERIFDQGFGKNTGLGLFLAREILALTEITIRENGVPGKGARFEIRVPKGTWRRWAA